MNWNYKQKKATNPATTLWKVTLSITIVCYPVHYPSCKGRCKLPDIEGVTSNKKKDDEC